MRFHVNTLLSRLVPDFPPKDNFRGNINFLQDDTPLPVNITVSTEVGWSVVPKHTQHILSLEELEITDDVVVFHGLTLGGEKNELSVFIDTGISINLKPVGDELLHRALQVLRETGGIAKDWQFSPNSDQRQHIEVGDIVTVDPWVLYKDLEWVQTCQGRFPTAVGKVVEMKGLVDELGTCVLLALYHSRSDAVQPYLTPVPKWMLRRINDVGQVETR